jgi:hypothetical protein
MRAVSHARRGWGGGSVPQGLKPTSICEPYGTTESRALTRYVAGVEKAARCARIPGLRIETRASRTGLDRAFPHLPKPGRAVRLAPLAQVVGRPDICQR